MTLDLSLHRARAFLRRSLAGLPVLLGAAALTVPAFGETASDGGPCAGAAPKLAYVADALEQGRWDEAEAQIATLAGSHPRCGEVVLGRARLHAARGEFDEAEGLFADAVLMTPDDAVAHALFAEFQLSRGHIPQAAHLASRAIALDPTSSRAVVLQGRLLGLQGRVPEARAALERAVSLDPENAEARFQLGALFYAAHLFAEAVPHFERAIALNPLDTRIHDNLALCFELLGVADRADTAYVRALAANDGPFPDPSLDLNYGRFLLKQGRLEESRVRLDRAVARFPDRRGPVYERAKLHLARGDLEAARADAERAMRSRDPSGTVLDLQVYFQLSTIYTRLGEVELAQRYAELARKARIPAQVEDGRR